MRSTRHASTAASSRGVALCRAAVSLTFASGCGHALIGRALSTSLPSHDIIINAMFTQSAAWYDVLHAHKDYASEARGLADLVWRIFPGAGSLLDVACGTGRHLEHFAGNFRCHGIDLDFSLLEIARRRLQGVPLENADMLDFRIDKRFDVIVCLYYAIGYARTAAGLRSAIRCMAGHLSPSGILVIEPWILRDEWHDGTTYSDSVTAEGMAVQRVYTSRRSGSLVDMEVSYAAQQETRTELHKLGLFTRQEYADAITGSGLNFCWLPQNSSGRRLALGLTRSLGPAESCERLLVG